MWCMTSVKAPSAIWTQRSSFGMVKPAVVRETSESHWTRIVRGQNFTVRACKLLANSPLAFSPTPLESRGGDTSIICLMLVSSRLLFYPITTGLLSLCFELHSNAACFWFLGGCVAFCVLLFVSGYIYRSLYLISNLKSTVVRGDHWLRIRLPAQHRITEFVFNGKWQV